MIIGNFSYDLDQDTYTGEITTLTFQRSDVMFRPTNKEGDKEPDYRIVREHDGVRVEFGAAWIRSSERGGDFLSVLLDDPALPSSVNAAMFLSDNGESATLVWQRQNKKPAAEAKHTNVRSRRLSSAHSPNLG